MNLNISIDLTDVFPEDGDLSLSETLKEHIVYEVQRAVWKEFSDEAKADFSAKVRAKLEGAKQGRIDSIIDEVFSEEKIRKSPYDSTDVTMKDFVSLSIRHQTVSNQSFIQKIDDTLKKQSEEIVKQLKERYDMLFASQIVARINEAGMLKDDVARLLLDNTGNG